MTTSTSLRKVYRHKKAVSAAESLSVWKCPFSFHSCNLIWSGTVKCIWKAVDTNLICFFFWYIWRFFGLLKHSHTNPPSLKWPRFKRHEAAAALGRGDEAASALVEVPCAQESPAAPSHSTPLLPALVGELLDGGSRGLEDGQCPHDPAGRGPVTAHQLFWGCIRCCFPTASEVPALAQSDFQVTLVAGNKTRLNMAGGSLQVVSRFDELQTWFQGAGEAKGKKENVVIL